MVKRPNHYNASGGNAAAARLPASDRKSSQRFPHPAGNSKSSPGTDGSDGEDVQSADRDVKIAGEVSGTDDDDGDADADADVTDSDSDSETDDSDGSAAGDGLRFKAKQYRLVATCDIEVHEDDGSWRAAAVYEHKTLGTVVLWYGDAEYEGIGAGYRWGKSKAGDQLHHFGKYLRSG